VSPDATRTFQPDKKAQQDPQPWPTVCPLTDEEIGIVEAPGGGYYPWDGPFHIHPSGPAPLLSNVLMAHPSLAV
jgi:hypothetical protein